MNIIYRVYEKGEGSTGYWGNYDNIVTQDVCLCNSREQFKDIMRSMYGPEIRFANSKKLPMGTPYVVIISEDCNNAEDYVSVEECTCAQCGRQFKVTPRRKITLSNIWHLDRICHDLAASKAQELNDMVFCSPYCRGLKEQKLEETFRDFTADNDIASGEYIDTNSFSLTDGYIYKITKKSTGEFYIGQTKYMPIFRWGQHLKTQRFTYRNIDDYIFEVLDKVPNDSLSLHTREAWYINEGIRNHPDLCLNRQIPVEENWKKKQEALNTLTSESN